ncbi:Bax inhibitor-1/YccA family protein [Micromonospora sp. M12]
MASRTFEQVYPGIVVQAVAGTFGVFLGMAALYRARVIRRRPAGAPGDRHVARHRRAQRGQPGVVPDLRATGPGGLQRQRGGRLVAVRLLGVAIIAGAFSFILDFDLVERSVRDGRPRRYAWLSAFGLLTGLVFLYWQILRLLSYLRR